MYKLLIPFSLLALFTGCDGAADPKTDLGVGDSGKPGDAPDEDGDGWLTSEGDCDDNNAEVNPTAAEICDGIDNNCNSTIDEDVLGTFYEDNDSDGFGNPDSSSEECDSPAGYVQTGTDCDDTDDDAFPGNTERCDGIDNNCDGAVDEGVTSTWYADADGDGYGDLGAAESACGQPDGYVADSTDCDDTTANAYPGNAEVCDEVDNNCDGQVDEDVTTTYYADFDDDGFGSAALTEEACAVPTGYTVNDDDCDDNVAAVNPDADEVCNRVDDDCNGSVDDGASDVSTYYADTDGDSYGDRSSTTTACALPVGYVSNATDCDDTRALTSPGATEYCNAIDDDCDGQVDEDSAADAPTWYIDADSDGYGNAATSDVQCSQPTNYVADNTDCIDSSPISYPGADEICDGLDNDCDGTADDSPIDGNTYYADSDADGFGDPALTSSECAVPSGFVENYYDCDDGDRGEPVVADAISGSSSGSGTLGDPFDALQDAIDNAYQCVIAYRGTYREAIDLDGKSIDIWGVDGYDFTTIDPDFATCTTSNPTACGSAITIASSSGATPTMHGFTVTGGTGKYTVATSSTTCADSSASHSGRTDCTVTTYEYCGGGLYIEGDDPSFYDMDVRNNTLPVFERAASGTFSQTWMYSYGGGVCLKNANASFEDSWIGGNFADQGGGVYAEDSATLTFEHGYVSENDAEDGGGVNLSGASATFTNAVVHCNTADTDGGGLFTEASGTATFTNAVLYGNTSSTSGSMRGSQAYIGTSTTFNLYNSIAEASTTVPLIYGSGGSGTADYDNVYNGSGTGYGGTLAAGTGAISSGNNFNSVSCEGNPYNDDFTLRSASGANNAGNPAAAYNDLDGTRNDMGAHGGVGGSW